MEKQLIDYDEYMMVFNKKFNNFLNKRPVRVEKVLSPEKLTIRDKTSGKLKTFQIDLTKDVQQFINEIQTWIFEEICPVMVDLKKEKREVTEEELEEMILRGEDVNSLLLKKKEKITKSRYRIERVLMLTDKLFVRNLETDVEAYYEMQMPVSTFLKNVRNKWSPEYSFQVFTNKSVKIYDVDPNYKKNK